MRPSFTDGDFERLSAFDGKEYRLFRSTWDLKLSHPERAHVEYNFDKIVETLRCPDEVRKSSQHKDCFIAYKKFAKYWVVPGVSAPTPPGLNWFAVVADSARRIVKTFYPTKQMKEGDRIWPNEQKTK